MHRVLAVLLLAQICDVAFGQAPTDRLCNYCDGQLELGIVLDSSSSISRDDFTKGKTFLKDYLKNFKINQQAVRVSIITFGRVPHPEDSFNLTTYNSNEDVAVAIDNIPHQAQTYTATGAAIKFMRQHQLAPQLVRNGVPRVSVVITDGNSQDTEITASEARHARDDGIVVFAIGVGLKIDNLELQNIAGDDSRVDRVDSYDKLTTITDWLAKQTCVKKE
ncbi:hypothetical protein BsWGS_26585 [Bradybaena similaris]